MRPAWAALKVLARGQEAFQIKQQRTPTLPPGNLFGRVMRLLGHAHLAFGNPSVIRHKARQQRENLTAHGFYGAVSTIEFTFPTTAAPAAARVITIAAF